MAVDLTSGHVTAPIGLAPLCRLLGEGRVDTFTACRSAKVNPYSLIRPLYSKKHDIMPEDFINANIIEASCTPANMKTSVLKEFDISTKNDAQYPSVNEYEYKQYAWVKWEPMKWGYWLPYVQRQEDIFALADKNVYWRRFYPADDTAETTANRSWCVLDQFDGYLHKAEPVNPLSNVVLEYAEKPSYTPVVIRSGYKDSEIFAKVSGGKGNTGGVVSIPAVFSDDKFKTYDAFYGVSLFTKGSSGGRFRLAQSAVGPKVNTTEGTSGLLMLSNVTGFQQISNCHEAVLVPWIAMTTKGETITENGGMLSLPTHGAKFLSYRFAKEYAGVERRKIQIKNLRLGSGNCSAISSNLVQLVFDVVNDWPKYPLKMHSLWLEIRLTHKSVSGGVANIRYGVRPSVNGVPGWTGPNGFGSSTLRISGIDASKVTQTVTFGNKTSDSADNSTRTRTVTMRIPTAGVGSINDNEYQLSGYAFGFTQVDDNHSTGTIIWNASFSNYSILSKPPVGLLDPYYGMNNV